MHTATRERRDEDHRIRDHRHRAAGAFLVHVRSLQVPIGRYVILKVTTDEGVTGLGEAPCILSWGGEHGKYFGEDPHIVCYLANECFAPMLAGEDPRAIQGPCSPGWINRFAAIPTPRR